MGTFVFRWPHPASDVHVTGTFDDWGKSEQLVKVGDVWEKEVHLSSADEKILYKFVVDDQWIVDHEAPKEDDGHYNVNNVLYPHEIKRDAPATSTGTDAAVGTAAAAGGVATLGAGAAAISSAAPGSTSATMAGGVPLEKPELERKISPPGAFPETPLNEPESFGVAPIPASSGIGNPISLPAGAKVPDPSTITSNTVDSTATTSKEGYEKDASAAFPPTTSSEPQTFGVQPIPATSGIGNPVSLPAGEKVPDPSTITSNTVDSTATTSKSAYEQVGEAAAGILGGTAVGAAVLSAFSKPEEGKTAIPESSLPMDAKATDTLDAGPTITSAAPTSTTATLAGAVPLEKKRQGMVIDPADAPAAESAGSGAVPAVVTESMKAAHEAPEAAASPEAVKEKSAVESELLSKTTSSNAVGESAGAANDQTSYYGLATAVPEPVEKSMAAAHAPAEAAAEPSVVAEKSAVEQELMKKIPSEEGAGEPAPTIAAATSTTAPVATPAVAAAAPETAAVPPLAEEPAVKMMQQQEAPASSAAAVPAAEPSTPAAAEKAAAVAPVVDGGKTAETGGVSGTPKKDATGAASTPTKPSTASSPATGSSATKDKKKKHRISGFFKKIFD